ncbi:HEAT repeat domain-containing protein [Paenibacillus montanisoli]|uniref:HEAT repeat domain-containing protein n=1 Tax=Paenibacillus montanisoli TaxID=2081970 RepID=A0A328TZF2_9BACL|nr:HEAT repeat domain-containing protein [Paenibacillus montanisoli]RAP75819.1 hypothetical protein DL346_10285 [Paenibacillus montanisoli]
MSVDLLLNLQQEVSRLFVAGSAMAEGDLRLDKLLPQLKRLGDSAPVFKRLAEATEGLLTSPRDESPAKLLELATLLSAVLHTQGKTDLPGEPQAFEGFGIALSTGDSFRKLQPLLEALTSKGPGRLEQLRQAYEDRSFLDLRALPSLGRGLDDSYSEIPDFIQDKLFPEVGADAAPVLRGQLNLQGGKGDARRLQLLYQLRGEAALETVLEAANSGSVEPKVAAIGILGAFAEQEPLILDLSREKRKEVRQAAFFALARLGSEQAVDRLFEAVSSKDRELVVEPARQCSSRSLQLRIVAHAADVFDRYLSSEGSMRTEAVQQLHINLRCLEGSGNKVAATAFPLLQRMLSSKAFITTETEAVQEIAAELLLELNLYEADHFALELQHEHKNKFIGFSFRSAYKLLTPAELFHRFAGELKGRSASARELQRALRGIVSGQLKSDEDEWREPFVPEQAWDPRWRQLFVELDLVDLVCAFTAYSDHGVSNYLASKLAAGVRKEGNEAEILLALHRIGYKYAQDLLMTVLEKESRYMYVLDWRLKPLIAALPKSYIERLRQFAAGLAYESVRNEVTAIVEAIEAAPDHTSEESGTGIWGWIKNKMS